jgi:hypothetical protein
VTLWRTTTAVSTEAELRAAFGDSDETKIDLASNITLGGGGCSTGSEVTRTGGSALTVDGHGFTVQQSCLFGVFRQVSTSAALTFQNITITGGNRTGDGGGIESIGPVTVSNSTSANNTASSGRGWRLLWRRHCDRLDDQRQQCQRR